jgi:beta-mannosidase
VKLEVYEARIEEVDVRVEIAEDLLSARVVWSVVLESPPTNAVVEIELSAPGEGETLHRKEHILRTDTLNGCFIVDKPELWYPVTYGSQPLYTLTLRLTYNSHPLDLITHRLAFRSAELIQRSLESSPGQTFFFRINSLPIFCAGSNWIPADTVLTNCQPGSYREHLRLLVQGNQNMLRVWGGGVYEDQELYSAADEMGVLIWQDFMFSCGQYPAHPTFLSSVRAEATQVVKRLQLHPSVVLFCGNNEDYQIAEAEKLDWDPLDMDPENWLKTQFPGRYIYEKVLPEICTLYAPGVNYHPGSPFGGAGVNDPTTGDIHQWSGTYEGSSR